MCACSLWSNTLWNGANTAGSEAARPLPGDVPALRIKTTPPDSSSRAALAPPSPNPVLAPPSLDSILAPTPPAPALAESPLSRLPCTYVHVFIFVPQPLGSSDGMSTMPRLTARNRYRRDALLLNTCT
jgi:hypothetical protein